MPNDVAFVHRIVARLEARDCRVWVFGGWAEQFRGITGERDHHDVDLLLLDESFDAVDAFMAENADVEEIVAKRSPHKRAFELDQTMVELLLVGANHRTTFWGECAYEWPSDTFEDVDHWPRLASVEALRRYRCQRPPSRPVGPYGLR